MRGFLGFGLVFFFVLNTHLFSDDSFLISYGYGLGNGGFIYRPFSTRFSLGGNKSLMVSLYISNKKTINDKISEAEYNFQSLDLVIRTTPNLDIKTKIHHIEKEIRVGGSIDLVIDNIPLWEYSFVRLFWFYGIGLSIISRTIVGSNEVEVVDNATNTVLIQADIPSTKTRENIFANLVGGLLVDADLGFTLIRPFLSLTGDVSPYTQILIGSFGFRF